MTNRELAEANAVLEQVIANMRRMIEAMSKPLDLGAENGVERWKDGAK